MIICPSCGGKYKSLRSHIARSTQCSQVFYSTENRDISAHPPIPAVINTDPSPSTSTSEAIDAQTSDSFVRARLRTRRTSFNYSDIAAKQARRSEENFDVPTPDDDLGDYVSTFFDNDEDQPAASSVALFNSAAASSMRRRSPEHLQDMLEYAVDSWNASYGVSVELEHTSVAALARAPGLAEHEPLATIDPTPMDRHIGTVRTMTIEQQNSRIVASPQDRSMARIYRLLDSAGSPRYLADAVMRQIRTEMVQNNFDPCDSAITLRDAFMHRASRSTGLRPPEAIPITLESGQKVTVFRFPFLQFYQEHLLSAPFSDINNLSVDALDPWGAYSPDASILKDMHDGRWHSTSHMAYCNRTVDHENFVFNPLLQYMDKTGADGIMKMALEPVMWISSCLKQNWREDSTCWFPGGFIPNLAMLSAAGARGRKQRKYSRSASVRDYHRCLEVLMQPLKDLQRDAPAMFHRRGDEIKCLRTVSPLLGVVGDNKNHDTLTARMGDYGHTTPRLCRRCLTEFARGGDSVHNCFPVCAKAVEYLSMAALGCVYGVRRVPNTSVEDTDGYLRFASTPISDRFEHWVEFLKGLRTKTERKKYIRLRNIQQKICDLVLHKVYGSHIADNAYFGLDFGTNVNGIFRAALTDIMHTIQEGLIPKFLTVFYGLMADKQRTDIDALVQALFCEGHNRSSERHAYPRVSFTRGYTQLTMLSADERVGQLFVLALLLQMRNGRDVLKPRFDVDFDSRRDRAKEQFTGGLSEASVAASASANDDVLSSDAADDESCEDPMHLFNRHNDNDSDVTDDGTLSEVQLKRALDNLDLSHLLNGIRPFLDAFHKERLDQVLAAVITPRVFNVVSKVTLPSNLTDYRVTPHLTVPVPAVPQAATPPAPAAIQVDDERADNSIKLPMDKFVYVVETILSLHAFLKYGCSLLVTSPTGIADYKRVLETFLHTLVATVDRGDDTNQWCLQKMLELVHFLEDVLDYGPASGFSTETGERGLKKWAKAPAKTAQKRSDEVFSRQVCMRIHESVLINKIADAHPLDTDVVDEEGSVNADVQLRCANFVVDLHHTAIVTRVLASGKARGIQIDFPIGGCCMVRNTISGPRHRDQNTIVY